MLQSTQWSKCFPAALLMASLYASLSWDLFIWIKKGPNFAESVHDLLGLSLRLVYLDSQTASYLAACHGMDICMRMRTTNQPLATSSCKRHARDWNTCRMVLSPIMMSRCPAMHCEKSDASKAFSSHACGSKVLRYSCTPSLECLTSAIRQLRP